MKEFEFELYIVATKKLFVRAEKETEAEDIAWEIATSKQIPLEQADIESIDVSLVEEEL